MHTKLTLRLDYKLIQEAKQLARQRGKSLSRIIADYFRLLGRSKKKTEEMSEFTPLVRSLKGRLRGAKVHPQDIRRHWEGKYL